MSSDYGGPSGYGPHYRDIGREVRWMQHQYLEDDQAPHRHPHPHPFSSAQSQDLYRIQVEIEKQRIRQEIIMSEILRRRALEAEVRRELMEEALQGGSNGFHFGSSSVMGLDLRRMRLPLVEPEGSFLERRTMLTLTDTNNYSNRRETQVPESLQFQRASDDVRNSEVKPLLEGVEEKKKINLQAKAMETVTGAGKATENITGAKRALSESDATESEYSNLKKKAKKDWKCDLCQVRATSERGLNDHLQGKKHKTKEAAPGAQNGSKSYSIGLDNKKVASSIKGSGTVDLGSNSEVKLTSEPLPLSKSGDAITVKDDLLPLPGNLISDNLKKDESVEPHKLKKNDKENRLWCEICKISVFSPKVMDAHKMGKKHRREADKIKGCGEVNPI